MAHALNELDIVATVNGDAARVVISGELDINSAPRLIATIHDIARPPVRRVDLDCEGVTFLDSAGVRTLIVVRKEAARIEVDLVLVQPSPAVSRVMEMTGLVGLLTGARSS